jgi:hypothetical protein
MSTSESRLLAGLSPTEPWKPRSGLVLSTQLASLAVSGLIVWRAASSTRLVRPTLAGAAAQACGIALLALLCSGAIMIAFQLVSGRSLGLETLRSSLRTGRTALWLAPIAILISRLPAVALAAALVFAISATQLLYFRWLELERVAGPIRDDVGRRFRASAFAVALGAQTTLVAVWTGVPLLAATLLCLTAAGLMLLCLAAGASRVSQPANLPDSMLGTLLTLILAAGLTTGGGLVGFGAGPQASGEPDPRTRPSPHRSITTLYQPSPGSKRGMEVTDKSFPGVILWPEVKETHRELVAPRAFSWLSPVAAAPRTPFRIPFSGQYWMLKPPWLAPPPGSYFQRASPVALSFLTTDQQPMSMRALQKLEHPLDLTCCRAIQLSISNADRYPGTIALELQLIDTQAPGQYVQSLGQRSVVSRPLFNPVESLIPVTEVLDFSIPQSARIRQFDEFQVLFHRDFFRIDRSAKISIEYFILVP